MSNALLMIDVSSNNGPIDVAKMHRAGFRAIAVKATEGASYVNPLYAQTVDAAHRAGMIVVHYHFATASRLGLDQVHHFLGVVKSHTRAGDRWALDIEGQPATYEQWRRGQARALADSFLHELWQQAPRFGRLRRRLGRLVYGPAYFIRDEGIRPKNGEGLWLAAYGSTPPFVPPGWRSYTIWQFTDRATGVPGTNGPVDESHLRAGFLGALRYPRLRPGATGPAVRLLQRLLNERRGEHLAVDGVFGRQTANAVIRLKRARRWKPVTGNVGRRAWQYLTSNPKGTR